MACWGGCIGTSEGVVMKHFIEGIGCADRVHPICRTVPKLARSLGLDPMPAFVMVTGYADGYPINNTAGHIFVYMDSILSYNYGAPMACIIDRDTGSLLATRSFGAPPQYVAFDGRVIWSGSNVNTIMRTDVNTMAVLKCVAPYSITNNLVFDGKYIWAGSNSVTSGQGLLQRFDPATCAYVTFTVS